MSMVVAVFLDNVLAHTVVLRSRSAQISIRFGMLVRNLARCSLQVHMVSWLAIIGSHGAHGSLRCALGTSDSANDIGDVVVAMDPVVHKPEEERALGACAKLHAFL